jgi:hypothetical protein
VFLLVGAKISVPAGLGEGPAGVEQPGAGDESAVDGPGEAVVGAAGVADGGESPRDGGFQEAAGVLGDERRRHVLHVADVGIRRDGVEVRVDEARHERAARQIHHPRAGGGDGRVGDLLDALALHQNFEPFAALRAEAVEQPAVTK